VTQLLEAFPSLQVDIRLSDSLADIIADGLDAVVRIGELKDSRLVARQIDEQQLIVCASRSYLRNNGAPDDIHALTRHRCLVFRLPASGRQHPWQFIVNKEPIDMHPNTRLCVNDGEAIMEAVKLGAGLAQIPGYMAESALADGSLVEIMSEYRPAPVPISLVTPGGRMMSPRVRAFIDAMSKKNRSRAKRRQGL
jgi:DNA-binding transcriptional LysR family regulator